MLTIIKTGLIVLILAGCTTSHQKNQQKNIVSTMKEQEKKHSSYSREDTAHVTISDKEWQEVLPDEVFRVARLKGTERPGSSPIEHSKQIGTYYCRACGNPLFKSDTKFDSGCGWPSFYEPISKTSIIYTPDNTHGMVRTEVQCGRCKAHLGHVFEDGPPPTGLRYCINGVILDFGAKE